MHTGVTAPQVEFKSEDLPRHVAIIMDGNGRWAKARKLPRVLGHRKGADTVRRIVEECVNLRLKVLTLFAFSSENWRRPKFEVDAIMSLIDEFILSEREVLHRHRVRLKIIGDVSRLSPKTQTLIRETEAYLQENDGLLLTIALSYGGRADIVEACKAACRAVERGELSADDLDENTFDRFLSTSGLPEPDLLIRTSGEQRISNFLLWQLAYSELVFSSVLWPDFTKELFRAAILEFLTRQRRFGDSSPVNSGKSKKNRSDAASAFVLNA